MSIIPSLDGLIILGRSVSELVITGPLTAINKNRFNYK
jgi:hypothetical protein